MSMTKKTPDASCRGLEVYRVGGVVRDRLLGRRAGDADYVVVGATREEMKAGGFSPVARGLPVFCIRRPRRSMRWHARSASRAAATTGLCFTPAPRSPWKMTLSDAI